MKKIILAPSILSADFTRLGDEIKAAEDGGADWIHLDVMDGRFVPNITFGPLIVEAVNRLTELPLDVHLMIVQPEKYIADFYRAGADYITIHLETSDNVDTTLKEIRKLGAYSGLSIKPKTAPEKIESLVDYIDLVLVMSVEPGFGGQKFIPSALDKISRIAEVRKEFGVDFKISVDGGIKECNAADVTAAGADIIVAGSSVFKGGNPAEALKNLRNAIAKL